MRKTAPLTNVNVLPDEGYFFRKSVSTICDIKGRLESAGNSLQGQGLYTPAHDNKKNL